jgi:hypothetical protein
MLVETLIRTHKQVYIGFPVTAMANELSNGKLIYAVARVLIGPSYTMISGQKQVFGLKF